MSENLGTITEPAREVPVRWEAEVVVCGGGPAGTAAAIAAAREGADVLLLERYGCLGGLATGGLVVVLPAFQDSGRPIIGGIGFEMRERMLQAGEAEYRWPGGGSDFDPEAMKWHSIRMCKEVGVRILHHVWVAGAIVEDGRVAGVIVESKAGRLAVRGKQFVDATGDGDVFAGAGCAFETSNQYIGLPYRLGGVDMARLEAAREEDAEAVNAAIAAAKELGGWESYSGLNPTQRGLMWGNNMLIEADALDPEVLTHVELEGREAIWRYVAALRETVPGYEAAFVVDTASQVGVRRSRRLTGEYVLTEEDVQQEDFRIADAIGRGNDFRKSAIAYDIPYRSLLPTDVEGLLVAGRCISCAHEALEPLREIHVCWVMGEAAGMAAAMAVTQDAQPRDVAVEELQGKLKAEGVAFAE